MNDDAFRKAAILISSVDAHTADALLDQMESDQAARIRSAIMEMDSPSEEEQHRVMQEFLGRDGRDEIEADGGVELELSFEATPPESTPAGASTEEPRSASTFFQHLEDADIESLAYLLTTEHPQTTAVVIAHLSPERAAEVVARLPSEAQTDILLRVARMEATSPEVIRDIEEEMRAMLVSQQTASGFSRQGLATVAAILEASPDLRRTELFAQLSERHQPRASHLRIGSRTDGGQTRPFIADTPYERTSAVGQARTNVSPLADGNVPEDQPAKSPGRVTFAMLESFEEAALAAVIREADAETAILALAGASHKFVQRILRGMPNRESRMLERKMQQLGPLRLIDVERAQAALAQLAEQLFDEGKITRPKTQRFAVAV
jgi:flagellar motor switch protein FliG